MKNYTMIIASVLMGLALAACNTMEGAGQDIQAGGRSLERSADENR